MSQRGTYWNKTQIVSQRENWRNTIAPDSEAFKEIIANGETFRYIKLNAKYNFLGTTKNDLDINLTCSAQRKNGTLYYYAHARLRHTRKRLIRKYIGKQESVTAEKLNQIVEDIARLHDM